MKSRESKESRGSRESRESGDSSKSEGARRSRKSIDTLVFQAQQLTPLATKSKDHPLSLLLARELIYLVRELVH